MYAAKKITLLSVLHNTLFQGKLYSYLHAHKEHRGSHDRQSLTVCCNEEKCAPILTLLVNAGCERPGKSKHRMQLTSLNIVPTYICATYACTHTCKHTHIHKGSFLSLLAYSSTAGRVCFVPSSLPSNQLDQSSGASCNGTFINVYNIPGLSGKQQT